MKTSRAALKCSAWVTSTRGRGLMGLKEGQWGWGVRGKKFQLHHKTFLAIVLCAWKPHAHVRVRLLTRTVGKNLKIQPPNGAWGYPQFFFTPNLIFFVTLNPITVGGSDQR